MRQLSCGTIAPKKLFVTTATAPYLTIGLLLKHFRAAAQVAILQSSLLMQSLVPFERVLAATLRKFYLEKRFDILDLGILPVTMQGTHACLDGFKLPRELAVLCL
ncbi:hypothetical protein FVE85_0231 [Porphyridium purpureum]|uniref:Uncharacterized protein n=1 Tax=Porphyridium purpureum TaxID=35688 RepID=A0A5J4Z0B5_PORPP|nr:hypothetical protein FVE85_0231 [Porphyridium purpureum]|eukprot:POR5914..scf208_2